MTTNVVHGNGSGHPARGNLWSDARAFKSLTNKRVWVERPFDRNELDVYWLPPVFRRDIHPKGYNVYRSQCPLPVIGQDNVEGPLNTLGLVTVTMFQDTTVDVYSPEVWYYIVTQVLEDGREVAIEEPVTIHNYLHNPLGRRTKTISMPRVFLEYKRRKHIILSNDAEYVDILMRRQSGTRCSCYDPSYESAGNSACPDCYGVGWDGGYVSLRDVLMRVYSVKETLERQPDGLKLKSNPTGWLVDFPILRAGDVVVRKNGERLEISNVDFNIHQGILTEQGFDLFLYEPTHPVYGFGVETTACQ